MTCGMCKHCAPLDICGGVAEGSAGRGGSVQQGHHLHAVSHGVKERPISESQSDTGHTGYGIPRSTG